MKKSVICIALAAVTLAACNNTEKEAGPVEQCKKYV